MTRASDRDLDRRDPTRLTLEAIAEKIGARDTVGDLSCVVCGVAEPAEATGDHVSFLTDPRRLEQAQQSSAAAFIVARPWPQLEVVQLICDDPRRAMAALVELFYPPRTTGAAAPSVDPRAVVAPDARLAPSVSVGPFAMVGSGTRLGEQTRVAPLAYIGNGVDVGDRCVIGPAAVLCDGCSIGDDVVVGPGAVVGHEGFGYVRDDDGWQPVRSVGNVEIGNGAEIGANACVDRGTLGPTVVGDGAKLDNLVQVGHNARIGNNALLCAQVGLAGSVDIDDDAVLAGQVGVADHLRVGRGARVGAKAGVARDVPDEQAVSGYPAFEHRAWLRASALLPTLGELVREVRRLRREVDNLKKRCEALSVGGD